MKSWLAQGSSGRRVTLLPGTTFLQINGVSVRHVAHTIVQFENPLVVLGNVRKPSRNFRVNFSNL